MFNSQREVFKVFSSHLTGQRLEDYYLALASDADLLTVEYRRFVDCHPGVYSCLGSNSEVPVFLVSKAHETRITTMKLQSFKSVPTASSP